MLRDVVANNDSTGDSAPPSRVYSRTVQELLERHGLAAAGRLHNGNVTAGAFVQVGPSPSQSESEPRAHVRPDPIGTPHSNGDRDAAAVDVNGNSTTTTPGSATANYDDETGEETEELAKLRCQSVRTEVLAEKFRRKNRCSDYPGFGFASSIFSSDTMMKFSIIKNELHNIMNNQLKRVSHRYHSTRALIVTI